jgi:hypothetical protein
MSYCSVARRDFHGGRKNMTGGIRKEIEAQLGATFKLVPVSQLDRA